MNTLVPAKHVPAAHCTVLVADGHALAREGIKMLVRAVLGEVCFVEAADGDALLPAALAHPRLRLAWIDFDMQGMQGGRRLLDLVQHHPATPLVVVSARGCGDLFRHSLRIATVHALVLKSAGPAQMRAAIEAVMQGRKQPLSPLGDTTALPATLLTPRQEQVRRLLREGLSNKMIAAALGISAGTVKNHISEIFKVLRTTNRTQAARLRVEAE